MIKKITDGIHWTGKTDWEIRTFHGEEYSTHRGSSYNSYIVEDEKTVLIDTVWKPFGKEFVHQLRKGGYLEKIDFVIANHAEIDHSGALPELMREIPDVPVYCTKNGVKSLTGHYHQDWNFIPVKTGDRLNLGKNEIIFIEAPMLHWPDSMFSYLSGSNILFSNDAFGQHYASEYLFNDLVDQAELFQEAVKYYANILTPFSPLVLKKIDELIGLGVPVDMICPSHGVIWRKNPMQIVEQYQKWADNYAENQITLLYDTMWNGTSRLAEAIAEGIRQRRQDITVKLFNLSHSDKNDVITEVFRSKGILVGSPTINRGILTAVAGMMEEIRGLQFKNKSAAAFGTYGWSGESVHRIEDLLKNAGFTVVREGIKVTWNPDENALSQGRDFGRRFAEAL
ncbi:MAG: anaerobic nitric oxide reductase flavorubredoxin [Acidobacteria bacterium]|nr:anaerobic nitric oxide reductase flavorubredoxin [Acidobacteriota bacterium]